MGKNTNYKTIHGIIESLKSEIDSIVKALATAEEPVSKVVQEEITQTIAESAATSLAPTHPDLENLREQIRAAETSVATLAREKEELEFRINTVVSEKNTIEKSKKHANATIATLRSNKNIMERRKNVIITSLTASLKQAENRLAAERLQVQKLKKRLRVYTGIIISGAAATGALYTAGLYKTSPRNMPRTKNNVKAFMNATQTFNTNAYMRQAIGGKNQGKLPASVRSGRNRAATPLLPSGMGTGSTAPTMLRLPPGSSTGGSARPNAPTRSSSIVSVPAAVALVGGAYLAKRVMGRKGKIPIQKSTTRNSMTANESWIRGQSQNVRGNIYNNNTNNTARSLTPSERAVKVSKQAAAFMRRQKFPEPRNTLYYSKEAVRRAKEAGNYRRRQRF
jgi:hypothetical protein